MTVLVTIFLLGCFHIATGLGLSWSERANKPNPNNPVPTKEVGYIVTFLGVIEMTTAGVVLLAVLVVRALI